MESATPGTLSGSNPAPEMFTRQATGLVRSARATDALFYNVVWSAPALTIAFFFLLKPSFYQGSDFLLEGELTLHGVTKPVALKLEVNGFTADPYGGQRAGFSASGEINRKDFGIDISVPMDGGGVVVGDKVTITLEIEAVLDQN